MSPYTQAKNSLFLNDPPEANAILVSEHNGRPFDAGRRRASSLRPTFRIEPTHERRGPCAQRRRSAYVEMDGASNRGIDAVRELNDAARYQPAALRKKVCKVCVIDEVHMHMAEAFKALLKTLEEPPEHVTFVLAAHLAHIFEEEGLDAEPGAVSLIVRESGGSVRDALSLCGQVISFVGAEKVSEAKVAEFLGGADRALTRILATALAEGNAGEALKTVDSAVGRGVDEVGSTSSTQCVSRSPRKGFTKFATTLLSAPREDHFDGI